MSVFTRKQNIACLIIAALPVPVLAVLYNKLVLHPYTHINGSGGITVSRPEFFIILLLVSAVFYQVAITIANRFSMLTTRNRLYLRIAINLVCSALSIWLIVSNLAP